MFVETSFMKDFDLRVVSAWYILTNELVYKVMFSLPYYTQKAENAQRRGCTVDLKAKHMNSFNFFLTTAFSVP